MSDRGDTIHRPVLRAKPPIYPRAEKPNKVPNNSKRQAATAAAIADDRPPPRSGPRRFVRFRMRDACAMM